MTIYKLECAAGGRRAPGLGHHAVMSYNVQVRARSHCRNSSLALLVLCVLCASGFAGAAFAAAAPRWATAIPLGEWAQVTTDNVASDVDPRADPEANLDFPAPPAYQGNVGYRGIWDGWNSASFAPNVGPCGSILYFGGGREYQGNQVVGLNICGGTDGRPLWERITNPYNGALNPPYSAGAFANRTPSPPATYDLVTVDTANNALVVAETSTGAPDYGASSNAWVLDLKTRQWRGPYKHRGARYGVSTFDTKRKVVWFQPQNGQTGELTSLNVATGKLAYFGWPYRWGLGTVDSLMGYDPLRDKLVLFSLRSPVPSIAERVPGAATAKWTMSKPELMPSGLSGAHSLAWSSARSAWIVWMDKVSGAKVYEVKYRTTGTDGLSIYTWTNLTTATNKLVPIQPSTPHNGGFERFQLVKFDDGSEVLVGQLRLQDGTFAFRVSRASKPVGASGASTPVSAALPALIANEPTAPAPSLAAQASSISSGHWRAIVADNTARAVDPERDPVANLAYPAPASYHGNSGYSAVWEAWNSGVMAPSFGTCGAILYYGGGHADYWGNEVVALNLCGGQTGGPKWERLNTPYRGAISWPMPQGTFPDQTPVPSHTVDGLVFDPQTNSLVVLRTMGHGPLATSMPFAWRFNLDTRKWLGPYEHHGQSYGISAYDSKRKLVWFQPQQGYPGGLTSMDTVNGTFRDYGWPRVNGLGTLDSMGGYDPQRDKLIMTSFRNPPHLIAEHDLNVPESAWVVAEQRNAPAEKRGQHAFAWSQLRGAWIVWMSQGGAMVYEVRHAGKNSAGAPIYAWRPLTAITNIVSPIASGIGHNGAYEKFQIVRTAAGDELLLGQLRLRDGLFAFKIPAPGAEPPAPAPVTEVNIKFNEPGWSSICGQAGVFVCDNFGDVGTLDGTLYAGAATPFVADGSLVFDIPSHSPADAGGHYRVTFPAIGAGQFLAFAYRVKADAGALALPGRKQYILWRGASSCTDLQLAQTHLYSSPLVVPYTECGSGHFDIPISVSNLRYHYPDYNCTYQGVRASFAGCVISHPDRWEDFYVELQIGTLGQANSRVVMWHRTDDGVWKRYIERNDFTFRGTGGFDQFMLTVYMTGKNPTLSHAPGRVLYDHLILSRQPLAKELLTPHG